MKIVAALLCGLGLSAPGSNPAPEPETPSGTMDTKIVMINMNAANIVMNMGDFRGNEEAGEGAEGAPWAEGVNSEKWGWSFLDGIQDTDMADIKDLIKNDDVQQGSRLLSLLLNCFNMVSIIFLGLGTLVQNLPGFSSFVEAITAKASEE